MDDKILEVKNLNVTLGNEKVIDNLNFDFKEGESLAVIGPNGAGKTVLLKSLLGISLSPDRAVFSSGEINWKEGLKISYVPQKILPERDLPLTIEEFFKIKKISSRDDIARSLSSVGISDPMFAKKRIGTISFGQLQRVLLAWALTGDPQVLLFDEPTTGIDIGGEETVYNLLGKIRQSRNLSLIIVTHDLSIVYKFADNVLCLNKKLICYGLPREALDPGSLSALYGGDVKFYKHEH